MSLTPEQRQAREDTAFDLAAVINALMTEYEDDAADADWIVGYLSRSAQLKAYRAARS